MARVDVFADGAFVDSATLVGGLWTAGWNSGLLPNGKVTIGARAYDVAGNPSALASVDVQVLDTTRPVVAFVEPAGGAVVHGVVPVSATADDDGVVESVAFDAGEISLGTRTAAPYQVTWDSTTAPDGKVTLGAAARDHAGLEGTASIDVTVDNSGPIVGIDAPGSGTVTADVSMKVHASDMTGVDHVDLWAGDVFLGAAVRADDGTYALVWPTSGVDNRTLSLVAIAYDLVGNASTSAAVPVSVKNLTTAEYDATLGVPACAASAAWCWSGTLLDGAADHEAHPPSTLGGTCTDGTNSGYHVTESIDALRVVAPQGSLASGTVVQVQVKYWAYVGNEADQIDVWHAADARNPTWSYVGTVTPVAPGAGEADLDVTLPSGPLQVIRANYRFAQPGPSTCSGGDFGDRDDLVFAVDSPADTVPPVVSLEAPLDGGTVAGAVYLRATAQDAQGVTRVEFQVDGALVAAGAEPLADGSATPRYQAIWDCSAIADGQHTLVVTAYDTSGNTASTKATQFTVHDVANAAVDASLGVPACGTVGSFCDTGTLVDGRGTIANEPNAPNTIGGSCADGEDGVYHQDESLDWLKVSSVDGLALAAGKRARVEARVWAYTGWSDDALDLFYATTPDDPHWIWFATVKPSGPGAQTLTAEYVLPPSGWQAIRGRYRYGGSVAPCGTGAFDDQDDVVFAADYTPNASYDAMLRVPSCGAGSVASCDSGTLVAGRATLGPEPNQPNTLGGACADGTVGAYHVDPSMDAILVTTDDGSALRVGTQARIELRTFASAAWSGERVDLFTSTNPSATTPSWRYLTSLSPTRAGSQVLVAGLPLGAAGPLAVRAHLLRPVGFGIPVACGTGSTKSVIDDHDDLVFTVAP